MRIEIDDVDIDSGQLLIREKKRSHKQRTTRHVSLSPFLKDVLRQLLDQHPGGKFLFCHDRVVPRSKKRSELTGYVSGEERATTEQGRSKGLRKRDLPDLGALTHNEVSDHLKRTLADSKWKVIRGFHVLRHSFISCLAANGIDQRIIDDFVGHQTDEQRRRYRHLLPEKKQAAIESVFGM